MMIARNSLFVGLLGLLFVGGCGPYVEGFRYQPHPGYAEIRAGVPGAPATQPATPPPVTAYATVVGVRRADSGEHLPLSIQVRLRLDNHGPLPASFDPASLDLTTGELVRFPPPLVRPPGPVTLEPGQTLISEAYFPFPPGATFDNINLQTLQFNWTVVLDGHPIAQSVDFHRIREYYYDPYWYGPGPYYPYPYYYPVGVGVVIRR
jgi:hypothetical protein